MYSTHKLFIKIYNISISTIPTSRQKCFLFLSSSILTATSKKSDWKITPKNPRTENTFWGWGWPFRQNNDTNSAVSTTTLFTLETAFHWGKCRVLQEEFTKPRRV